MTATVDSGVVPDLTMPLRLELARRHAGHTQKSIAAELGLSHRSVQGYEQGDRTPKRPTLMAWAAVTGVSLAWLLGDQYTPTDSNREPADLQHWVLAA